MGRTAVITIQNKTGHRLVYTGSQLIHGKFDIAPPAEIAAGGSGSFKVANSGGSDIGPKGLATYRTAVQVDGGEADIDVVFFWDHPFSASTSSYSVTSNPPGFSRYMLSPSIPEGKDAKVTISVWLTPTGKAYSLQDWMKRIDGERSIADMTIPGTHDSGATHGGPASQTQTQSIRQQLDSGIRFLDIRLKIKDGVLKVYHGSSNQQLTFQEVINSCSGFLDYHSDETIIMSVKNEDSGQDIGPEVYKAIKDNAAYWYTGAAIPKLKEVRKKIVLFRRFSFSEKFGLDASPWQKDDPSFWVDHGNIHVQDRYIVYDTMSSINSKWAQVRKALDMARTGDKSKMYVNFLSGAQGITPVMLATGAGIVVDTEGMNQHLYQYISVQPPARYGIVLMDFPEHPYNLLVSYIINTNWNLE